MCFRLLFVPARESGARRSDQAPRLVSNRNQARRSA